MQSVPPTRYVAPNPTAAQVENAKQHGFDAWDRAGSLPWWDFSADDTLAAPALIHDEETIRGGNAARRLLVDEAFCRDSRICADAADDYWLRTFELIKARGCCEVVTIARAAGAFWHEEDWNTPLTRVQSDIRLRDARRWVNYCAQHVNEREGHEMYELPYPDHGVAF